MRKLLLVTALTLSGATFIGFVDHSTAAPLNERDRDHGGRELAEKALRAYYGPIAEVHLLGDFESNGVRCFEADVSRDGQVAKSTVTGRGELLSMGLPVPIAALPAGAQLTARLFKVPLQSLAQDELHGYYLTVTGPEHRPFIVTMDATGKIRDIKSPEEIREDDPNGQTRVSGPDRHTIEEVARHRFPDDTIDGVNIAIHDPGYFVVGLKNEHGHGWTIISPQNDCTEWRVPTEFRLLPDAVRQAIDRDLRHEHITNIQAGARRVYRMRLTVGDDETIMLVKPDGAVDWINTHVGQAHAPFSH